MLTLIKQNDRDWDEECKGAVYVGQTQGCGCCSGWVPMTREVLEEHIRELEEMLEQARALLTEV